MVSATIFWHLIIHGSFPHLPRLESFLGHSVDVVIRLASVCSDNIFASSSAVQVSEQRGRSGVACMLMVRGAWPLSTYNAQR